MRTAIMSATSRVRKAAAALAAGTLLLVVPLSGTAAQAADESPSPETSTAPETTDLEKVNALVQPSVVFLLQTWSGYVYDTYNKQYLNEGNPFELQFQCTGFVVNPDGYIATAGHCVDFKEVQGAFVETAAQWALDNGYYSTTTLTLDDVLGFGDYRVESGEKRNAADLDIQVGWGASVSGIDASQVKRARVIDFNGQDKGDVALLKVEETDLNALPMATDEVEVGTDVVSIGYPASVDAVTDPNLTPSFKDGSISSVKTVQGGVLPVYEISAAVSGGMSGGPSVNLEGEVIGVNSFGILGEPQAFNFLRPTSQLAELMAASGVSNELTETTEAYREGLAAYWAGDKTTAVERLGEVVDEQPTNELAADFLEKAEELADPAPVSGGEGEGSDGGLPIVPILVAVLAVVVIGGGILAFVLLRRGKSPAAPVVAAPAPGPAPAAPAPAAPVVPVVTAQAPPVPAAPAPAAPVGGPPSPPPAPEPVPATPVGFAAPVAEPVAEPVTEPVTEPVVEHSAPTATAVAPRHEPHFCGNCGEAADAGKKFCSNCGSPLA